MNPWLKHVNKFRVENPDLNYKQALMAASKTYTPIQRGGGDICGACYRESAPQQPENGGTKVKGNCGHLFHRVCLGKIERSQREGYGWDCQMCRREHS